MCKVKSQLIRCHFRACLLYMRAQYFTQCFLQQMCGTVILFNTCPASCLNLKLYDITGLDHAVYTHADMADLASEQLNRIFYLKRTFFCPNKACIADLSAHSSIKRRLFYDNSAFFPIRKRFYDLCFRCHNRYL